MRILSFDQSITATAAVILDEVEPAKFRVISQEMCVPKKCSGIYRMQFIREWIFRRYNDTEPTMIVRELHNQRQFGAAGQIQVVGSIIDHLALRAHLLDAGCGNYAMITAGTWKKFCVGKGNLKKDTAYMMHINKFIQSTRYLQVSPDFQVMNDNIGDAICMGVCGAICRRILLDEPAHVSDSSKFVALKKCLPTMFDYGKPQPKS